MAKPAIQLFFSQRLPEMHVFAVRGASIPAIPLPLPQYEMFAGPAGVLHIECALVRTGPGTKRLAVASHPMLVGAHREKLAIRYQYVTRCVRADCAFRL